MARHAAPRFIFFTVLFSICRVFLANRQGNNKWIPLPPVARDIKTSLPIDSLAARVDRIVNSVMVNTAHPCLYFSYARCRVLRRCGYRAKMNIGLHNLYEQFAAEGHCWLSLENRALFEDVNPHLMYPDKMGERGDFVYWVRLENNSGKKMERIKNE